MQDTNAKDLEIFGRVVATPPRFDHDDESSCHSILEELDNVEVAALAETSYAYWYLRTNDDDDILPKSAQTNAALKEIQRHWIGEGRMRDKTISALRQALEYRQLYRTVELRRLFSSPAIVDEQDQLHKQWIEEDLQRQLMVVRGSTNTCTSGTASRTPMVFKPPRGSLTNAADNDAYIITQIYTAERAMATAEYLEGQRMMKNDDGGDDDSSTTNSGKLLVLFSFEGYQSSRSLTTTAMKISTQVLQRVYPERLFRLVIMEPPFWMSALMTLMYPFLSTDTANKLQLVRGKEETERVLQENVGRYDPKSMERILGGDFSSSVDIRHYLYHVPFHRLYDDF